MIRDLIPWNTLTRAGVPALKVARRNLVLGEVIVPVGETLDPELLPMQVRKQRLRQFYEMRLLEPVNPPANSRQFFRERVPLSPVTPVASRIVADLPAVEVPETPSDAKRKKGGR